MQSNSTSSLHAEPHWHSQLLVNTGWLEDLQNKELKLIMEHTDEQASQGWSQYFILFF